MRSVRSRPSRSKRRSAFVAMSERARAKLRVSRAGDPDEGEADHAADHALSGASGPFLMAGVAGVGPGERRGARSIHSTRVHSGLGGGRALPENERAFFQARLGYSFRDVRIHTGAEAAFAARRINARAFTLGRDIVFDEGEYRPGVGEGRRLLAHELTHTVQQQRAGGPGPLIQRKPGNLPVPEWAKVPGKVWDWLKQRRAEGRYQRYLQGLPWRLSRGEKLSDLEAEHKRKYPKRPVPDIANMKPQVIGGAVPLGPVAGLGGVVRGSNAAQSFLKTPQGQRLLQAVMRRLIRNGYSVEKIKSMVTSMITPIETAAARYLRVGDSSRNLAKFFQEFRAAYQTAIRQFGPPP